MNEISHNAMVKRSISNQKQNKTIRNGRLDQNIIDVRIEEGKKYTDLLHKTHLWRNIIGIPLLSYKQIQNKE